MVGMKVAPTDERKVEYLVGTMAVRLVEHLADVLVGLSVVRLDGQQVGHSVERLVVL